MICRLAWLVYYSPIIFIVSVVGVTLPFIVRDVVEACRRQGWGFVLDAALAIGTVVLVLGIAIGTILGIEAARTWALTILHTCPK